MDVQYDWIAHHASYAPDSLAHEDLHSGRRFTYRQMHQRVDRLAAYLQRTAGIIADDRVATLCHNSTDNYEILFACQRAGAIQLPLNWRLAVPELEFIVKDAEPRILFYSEEFADQAQRLKELCGIPRLVLKRDGQDSDYEQAIASTDAAPTPVPRALDDIWMLLYTSGTTGRPKGAQLTYRGHLFNCINATMKGELTRRSKSLVFLPQFHVGGVCLYALPGFHLGGATMIMRQFEAETCLKLLADPSSGVTHTFGVPTNFLFMSQLPAFAEARFDHLVSVGIGGAASPLALLELYAGKGLLFQQGWGMTETCSIGTLLSKERALDKIGSSGQQVLHTSLRIVDAEGRDLPNGEVGELLIKGPTVTPGYWRRAEANRATIVDGWLKTGDAAYIDDEGFCYIVDRWKDMYISGGENVYPAEVEDAIYRLPGVAECAVIGVPDKKWGEVGRAFVVPRDGTNLTESAVIDHCGANLARYKVPKSVRFLAELPHNATGKITKHALPRD
ncbi:long-chain fatty acid--CoA ligase [Vineibacter terrae]|uniref:3-methylmercaptopropionyl-CoA ligase n=1 Tax=Vineibacter terrae TaxID=2586908 RepID=A0A5C8PKW7_9HYPH|nr:long-chain fatty acid--CoA ligase [Vineibacter terrae]TXL74323.1 long-chain fatty acid--CoA ligase [Vineibacter terrae]